MPCQRVPESSAPPDGNALPSAPAALGALDEALQRDPQDALRLAEHLAAQARAENDDRRLAQVLRRLGEAQHRLANYPAALAAYLEAVGLSPADDLAAQASVWQGAARTQFQLANYRDALEYLEAALRLARAAGDTARELTALEEIALAHGKLGDHAQALSSFTAALVAHRAAGDERGVARSLLQLGATKRLASPEDASPEGGAEGGEAAELFEQAASLACAVGDAHLHALALTQLGEVRLVQGAPETAERAAHGALHAAGELGDRHLEARALRLLGDVSCARGQDEDALAQWQRALALCEQVGARADVAALHLTLASAHERLGHLGWALTHFKRHHGLDVRLRAEAAEGRVQAASARLGVQHARAHAELHRARNEELERLVSERTAQLEAAQVEMLDLLASAAEFRDAPLGPHVRWVGETAALLAAALGLSDVQGRALALAARLHDIGKIGIPDDILLKGGALDAEEWAVMRTHTTLGARMLARGASPLLRLAGEIALSHHERWDGSGYPRGLAGEEIPLVGRIVSVVDTFDALVSERPYKSAWAPHDALAYLRAHAGSLFDPQVVQAFERLSASGALPPRRAEYGAAQRPEA